MIKLIATDLDGTLFSRKNCEEIIEDSSIKVLRKFHQKGGQVAVVTGRGPFYTKWVSKKLGFECFDLSLNGAYNHFTKEAKTIPSEIVKSLFSKLKQLNKPYVTMISSKDGIMFLEKNKFYAYRNFWLQKRNEKYVNLLSLAELDNKRFKEIIDNNETAKILIYFKKDEDKVEYDKMIKNEKNEAAIYIYNSEIEVNAKGTSKGNAVKQLQEAINLQDEEILVVGDSYNDISMLELFPNSCTFSYANYDVQKVANYVVDEFKEIENYLY